MSMRTETDSRPKVLREYASGMGPDVEIKHNMILTELSAISSGKGYSLSMPCFPHLGRQVLFCRVQRYCKAQLSCLILHH